MIYKTIVMNWQRQPESMEFVLQGNEKELKVMGASGSMGKHK